MGMGIEIYDSSGNLIVDMGTRIFKILTTTSAGTGGSYTNSLVGHNIAGVSIQLTGPDKTAPDTSISGNTVSWGFSGKASDDHNATLQILAY